MVKKGRRKQLSGLRSFTSEMMPGKPRRHREISLIFLIGVDGSDLTPLCIRLF
jgi:hypothetical protein